MPMGIVSDAEFNSELKRNPSTQNETTMPSARIIQSPEKGRGIGNVGTPDSLRRIIGETAITDGPSEATQLGKNFGLSQSSVSAYTKGATSTASYDDRPNKDLITGTKLRIQSKARAKLIKSINALTDEKLETAKARDLAGIAKDMAAVIKVMEPESHNDSAKQNGPTFIFYSPQPRKEETYDVVFTKE